MNYLSKAVAVASLSLMSVNTFAAVNALDAIRDNLSGMYDDIKANSWGTDTSHQAGADAFVDLTEYASEVYSVNAVFSNGKLLITVIDNFDQEDWDGKVDAVSTGVLTDLFGVGYDTTDLIDSSAAGTGPLQLSAGDGWGTGALLRDDSTAIDNFDTQLEDLNDAFADEDKTLAKLQAEATSFNTTGVIGALNDNYNNTDGWLADVTTLKGLNTGDKVDDYGLTLYNNDCMYSGTGLNRVYYESYEDYVNGSSTSKAACDGD